MNALKLECRKYGITVNTVAPVALTRMTGGQPFAALLGEALPERLRRGGLAGQRGLHAQGEIVAAGAGYFARVQMMESLGIHLAADAATAEAVAEHWPCIADMANARPFGSCHRCPGRRLRAGA